MFEIINGDALTILTGLGDEGREFDAIVADPPYCSGGTTPADRARGVAAKYYNGKTSTDNTRWIEYPDAMDQWSTYHFTRAWLLAGKRVLKPVGYFFIFATGGS